jgi:hypothetical protein
MKQFFVTDTDKMLDVDEIVAIRGGGVLFSNGVFVHLSQPDVNALIKKHGEAIERKVNDAKLLNVSPTE